ncbi:MAG: hypothetical protein KDA52_04305 [Planctomycetaceae bacterium]|nr:hypothetical protein [Planctomycetaceae bacterium]
MRFCKQLMSIVTMVAVLCLPLAMSGCAKPAAPPAGGEADAGADTNSDLGQPEGGSALP